MKFVATKTAEQLDLQALHRVRERLVSQRTGIINQIPGPACDPPPLKWSDFRYVFDIQEDCNGKEAIQA
jgi:hypothetical protein